MFNARGASNILTKATWVLAAVFLINCVIMATINSITIKSSQTLIGGSIGDAVEPANTEEEAKPIDGKIAESATLPHPASKQTDESAESQEKS
jgi:hypothetical protein